MIIVARIGEEPETETCCRCQAKFENSWGLQTFGYCKKCRSEYLRLEHQEVRGGLILESKAKVIAGKLVSGRS